jgi:hypothetical protein
MGYLPTSRLALLASLHPHSSSLLLLPLSEEDEALLSRSQFPDPLKQLVSRNMTAGNTAACSTEQENMTAGNTAACNTEQGNMTAGNTTACSTQLGNMTAGNTTACSTEQGKERSAEVVVVEVVGAKRLKGRAAEGVTEGSEEKKEGQEERQEEDTDIGLDTPTKDTPSKRKRRGKSTPSKDKGAPSKHKSGTPSKSKGGTTPSKGGTRKEVSSSDGGSAGGSVAVWWQRQGPGAMLTALAIGLAGQVSHGTVTVPSRLSCVYT